DTINTTTVNVTANASVAEGGTITYTASLTSAAGTAMQVTLSNGAVITIAAGASSGSATVAAPGEDAVIDAGSVSATVTTTSGGNFEAVAVGTGAAGSPVVTTVTDTIDTTTLSLSASTSVAEGGNIVYTASVSNPAGTAMLVTLSGGTVITIAAGASSGSATVAAPTDDVYVDAGSVTKSVTGTSGGNFEAVANGVVSATTTVTDTINTTTVSLTGSASVNEGGTASYTVSLSHPAQTTAVTVNITYSGTATDGSDFTGVATVTIAAGSSSASFDISTIDDLLAEGAETLIVTVASATGGNFESLVVGSPGSVTTGIVDNDISTVSLSATPTLSEAGGSIVYTATLTQAPTSALTVTLSNGATITIAAGQTSGTTSVVVAADEDVYVDPSSVSATISSTSGGGIAVSINPAAATTVIADTINTTTVNVTANASVAEGGTITYTASLTSAAGTAMQVT
ncbi:MAG: type I secretion protein, partial [Lysobacteraceae bacterium]